jgi:hypothetical protein
LVASRMVLHTGAQFYQEPTKPRPKDIAKACNNDMQDVCIILCCRVGPRNCCCRCARFKVRPGC